MSIINLFSKKQKEQQEVDNMYSAGYREEKYLVENNIPGYERKHNIKDNRIIFCCDENKVNYSQKNNKYYKKIGNAVANSSTMCNVTSMVMAADYAGFKFPDLCGWEQPEDAFLDFMLKSQEIDKAYKNDYPVMYEAYKRGDKDCYFPNEIHSLLSLGLNMWLGTKATAFTTNGNFKRVLWDSFVNGSKPIVVSGSFPMATGKRYNHIVVVTGVVYDLKEFAEKGDGNLTPIQIKIDDPNGNPLTGWTGNGNDIFLDWQYCIENLKPLNSENIKWFHQFTNGVAVI